MLRRDSQAGGDRMMYVAIGSGIFCALVIGALLMEMVADWLITQIGGKVGR